MGFWVNGPGARRGRRVLFSLDEFEAWCLACRLKRLTPDGLRFVAAAITAAEIEAVRSARAPDSRPSPTELESPGAAASPDEWPSR